MDTGLIFEVPWPRIDFWNIENMGQLIPQQPKKEERPQPHRRFALMVGDHKLHLSEREKGVCEVFIRTNGNLVECSRMLQEKFHHKVGVPAIRHWMNSKQLLLRYLQELGDKRAELNSFTEDDWKLLGVNVLKGKVRIDRIQAQIWRDMGMQVFKKEPVTPSSQTNIQINFGEKE